MVPFRSGDRVFDLVTLGFCVGAAQTEPGVEERIWAHISREGSPGAVACYVAHMALRRLDWTIRHHPDEIGFWLDTARRYLRSHAA